MTPNGFPPRVPAAILTGLLMAACTGTEVRQSGPAPLSGLPQWELIEESRLGSVDDPNLGFTQIRGVQGLPDGNVLVGEGLLREVREYAPSGEVVRRIGRRGQGPGEFESLSAFGHTNGTLWVQDTRNLRLTLFSPDGEIQATIPGNLFTHMEGESAVLIAPRHPRADGTFLGAPVQWVIDDSIRIPVVTFAGTGEIADTLRWDLLRTPQVDDGMGGRTAVSVGTATLYLRDRLLPHGVVRFRSVHHTVAVDVSRQDDGRSTLGARLTVVRADGDTLMETQFSYEPLPVPESAINQELQSLLAFAEQVGAGRAAAESTIRGHVTIPPHLFPVTTAVVTEDGGVWLRREDTGAPTVRWSVLDAAGAPAGEVYLPVGAQVEWVGEDRLWVSIQDELDVPFLIRYRRSPN